MTDRHQSRANSARAVAPLQAEIEALRETLATLKVENEKLRADVAEWKARADDLAAALNNCIKLAYNCDKYELPSAIITTASKAVAIATMRKVLKDADTALAKENSDDQGV